MTKTDRIPLELTQAQRAAANLALVIMWPLMKAAGCSVSEDLEFDGRGNMAITFSDPSGSRSAAVLVTRYEEMQADDAEAFAGTVANAIIAAQSLVPGWGKPNAA